MKCLSRFDETEIFHIHITQEFLVHGDLSSDFAKILSIKKEKKEAKLPLSIVCSDLSEITYSEIKESSLPLLHFLSFKFEVQHTLIDQTDLIIIIIINLF